jgi:hypothetical protein
MCDIRKLLNQLCALYFSAGHQAFQKMVNGIIETKVQFIPALKCRPHIATFIFTFFEIGKKNCVAITTRDARVPLPSVNIYYRV